MTARPRARRGDAAAEVGAGMRPAVAVVLHDVASATWAACERLHRCVQQVAPVPVTWLAVPRWHGLAPEPAVEQALDAARARGDELALHGYTHWDAEPVRGWLDHARRRWYTAGEGEFSALAEAQAAQRLRAGRRWFERRRWPLHGFVAPAWLLSGGSRRALDAAGFDYTCTLTGLIDLRRQLTLPSRALVYSTRAAWRRALSVPWNAAVARRQRAAPLLRFELHPGDAEHARVRTAWMRLLEQALRTRDALTLQQAVGRWRESDGYGARLVAAHGFEAPTLPVGAAAADARRSDVGDAGGYGHDEDGVPTVASEPPAAAPDAGRRRA